MLKKASEIFHPVDPNLNVIDRGQRRTGQKPHPQAWDKAGGAFCPNCNQEAVRFSPVNGFCLECNRELNKKEQAEEKKRAKLLKVIQQHNARIDKRKGAR